MRSVKKLLLAGLFFYLPFQSMAWGLLGHRIVGEIADSYLTAKARKGVQQILGNESMAMASNWPDFIKSDPAYKYLNNWHYTDFDKNITYQQMQTQLNIDTTANIYTKVFFLVRELKNKNLAYGKKVMYLKLLIHLVGDMHQPLHASAKGTIGGNTVKVLWFNEPSNLHRVWDEQLIDYQQLSYTEYTKAINHTTIAQRKALQKDPISKWLFESYEISDRLHEEIKQPDQKLSYPYNFNHYQTLNQQLLKGGVRLAGLLNQIFAV
jgi:hypothetical protein